MSKKRVTARDVLIRATRYVRKGWTQRAHARDANGRQVFTASSSAVCWCAIGALVCAERDLGAPRRAMTAAIASLGRTTKSGILLRLWNDAPGRTQADVVAAFRRAAKASR